MGRLTFADVPVHAKDVIRKHQTVAPVPVGAIARELGVRVIISDLPLAVSGTLSRNAGEEDWTIRVNRHEHKNRQRFTIAHEIAHFVLHREVIGNELVDDTFYRSGLSEQREFEANALAADILMPWGLIRELMRRGMNSSQDLAQALEVSPAAMSIRLGLPT